MKKIFVTVGEFLEHGCVLNIGRPTYANYIVYGKRPFEGNFQGFDDMNMPLIGINKTPMSMWDIMVQVDCKPIYK